MTAPQPLAADVPFEKWVEFSPAYDRRDPNPSKNWGIHGVDILCYLRGPKGVIQFVLSTNWMLPHVQEETDAKPLNGFPYMFHKPQPTDIGYHSPVPLYEGQSSMGLDCPLLKGECYYDGSSLQAEDVFKILVTEGSYGLWKELERRYHYWFDAEDAE